MRFMGWLVRLAIGTLLASTLTIYTTWYIVNHYVERLLNLVPFSVDWQENLQIGDLLSQIGDLSHIISIGPNKREDEDDEPDAWPVFGHSAEEMEQQQLHEGQSNQLLRSVEQLLQMKDTMNLRDKSDLFALLTTRLPPHEIQRLSALLENGIHEADLQEMGRILQLYLSETEYDELITIINKY